MSQPLPKYSVGQLVDYKTPAGNSGVGVKIIDIQYVVEQCGAFNDYIYPLYTGYRYRLDEDDPHRWCREPFIFPHNPPDQGKADTLTACGQSFHELIERFEQVPEVA